MGHAASRLRLVIQAEPVMFVLCGLSRGRFVERRFRVVTATRECFVGVESGWVRSFFAQQVDMVGIGQTNATRARRYHIAKGILHNYSVSAVAFGVEKSRVRAV